MKIYARGFHSKRRIYTGAPQGLIQNHQSEIMLLLAFICGVIVINILGDKISLEVSLLNQYYIQHMIQAKFAKGEMFWYLLGERLPVAILLFVMHFTNIRNAVMHLFVIYLGFGLGIIMLTFVISFGGLGILVSAMATFPQVIVYAFGYFFLVKLSAFAMEEIQAGTLSVRYKMFLLLCSALFFGVIMLGIILESYINPCFLKKL